MREFIDPYYLAEHIDGKVANDISEQFVKYIWTLCKSHCWNCPKTHARRQFVKTLIVFMTEKFCYF